MTPGSLGFVSVPTPGTPVQLPAIACAKMRAQVVIGHTSKVYLGVAGMNKATFAGVIKEFWHAQSGDKADAIEIQADAQEGNPINLAQYFVDAVVGGEGLIISYWVK